MSGYSFYDPATAVSLTGVQALADNTAYVLTADITSETPFTFSGSGVGIVIDGSGHTFCPSGTEWPGLFSAPVTVLNLTVTPDPLSALARDAGWFFATTVGGVAYRCTNNGSTPGPYAQNGGIFGSHSAGMALHCTNTGSIGDGNGGIFGTYASGKAIGCVNTGAVGLAAGGIFGMISGGTALNCSNTGELGVQAGAIYGYNCTNGSAINCYNTGTNTDITSVGIVSHSSTGLMQNCYSSTSSIAYGYGPGSNGGITVKNCYSVVSDASVYGLNDSTTSGGSDTWSDASANLFLTGVGTIWTTASDTPYALSPTYTAVLAMIYYNYTADPTINIVAAAVAAGLSQNAATMIYKTINPIGAAIYEAIAANPVSPGPAVAAAVADAVRINLASASIAVTAAILADPALTGAAISGAVAENPTIAGSAVAAAIAAGSLELTAVTAAIPTSEAAVDSAVTSIINANSSLALTAVSAAATANPAFAGPAVAAAVRANSASAGPAVLASIAANSASLDAAVTGALSTNSSTASAIVTDVIAENPALVGAVVAAIVTENSTLAYVTVAAVITADSTLALTAVGAAAAANAAAAGQAVAAVINADSTLAIAAVTAAVSANVAAAESVVCAVVSANVASAGPAVTAAITENQAAAAGAVRGAASANPAAAGPAVAAVIAVYPSLALSMVEAAVLGNLAATGPAVSAVIVVDPTLAIAAVNAAAAANPAASGPAMAVVIAANPALALTAISSSVATNPAAAGPAVAAVIATNPSLAPTAVSAAVTANPASAQAAIGSAFTAVATATTGSGTVPSSSAVSDIVSAAFTATASSSSAVQTAVRQSVAGAILDFASNTSSLSNTAIFAGLANTPLAGQTISVSSATRTALVAGLSTAASAAIDTTLAFVFSIPDQSGNVVLSPSSNGKYAIDLTAQKTFPIVGFPGYAFYAPGDSASIHFQTPNLPDVIITAANLPITLNFTDAAGTPFTTVLFDLDLGAGNMTQYVPPTVAQTKAMFDPNTSLMWILSSDALSTYDGSSQTQVVALSSLSPTSFALDVSNQNLYLGTQSGLYSASYSGSLTTGSFAQVTRNGVPITNHITDMAISPDTLYYTTSTRVSALPLAAGAATTVIISDAVNNQETPLAITYASGFVYVSTASGSVQKLDASLSFVDRNSFPMTAPQVMINKGSIMYAASGVKLWSDDYQYTNQEPGSFGYFPPNTVDISTVAVVFNVNADGTVQQNYMITSDNSIYLLETVDPNVMNIILTQMYPVPSTLQFTTTSSAADVLDALESYPPETVITIAETAGVSNTVILLAFAQYAAANGTTIFSSLVGTSYEGTSATVSAANAAALYASLNITGTDAAKDIYFSAPNVRVLTLAPFTYMNISLAIDDTVDATYTFADYPGYSLTIASSVQTFITPTSTTVLSQGSSMVLSNTTDTVTYNVLSLDLTLGTNVDPPPTTAAPTTIAPTTSAPTTAAPTTSAPTTAAPTTAAPTTAAPTTSAPTTAAPTTAAPTTAAPTTIAPTTAAPTTAAPTTAAPTTSAPTTAAPTTSAPTTAAPTTAAPTTAAPTTAAPSQFDGTVATLFMGSASTWPADISAALLVPISDAQIIVQTLIRGTTTNSTSIYSLPLAYYPGTTTSIAANVARNFYKIFPINGVTLTTVEKSYSIDVCVPAQDNTITINTASSNNVLLPLDLSIDAVYPLVFSSGETNYSIIVANGIQTLMDGSTVVATPGDMIAMMRSIDAIINPTTTTAPTTAPPTTAPPTTAPPTTAPPTTAPPTTEAPTTQPPAPICFFGDAPVKTPSGYKRIDSLKIGDVVSTPNGTAVIKHIHCKDYASGPHSNPYMIPKGRYGATQDLLISPRHKVSVNGQMVEVRDLGLVQQQKSGTLTYYNLGLPRWANMIVAGVTVESMASLSRVTISRAEFEAILASRYGGRMTPEIRANCQFLADGSVSVPSIRR